MAHTGMVAAIAQRTRRQPGCVARHQEEEADRGGIALRRATPRRALRQGGRAHRWSVISGAVGGCAREIPAGW